MEEFHINIIFYTQKIKFNEYKRLFFFRYIIFFIMKKIYLIVDINKLLFNYVQYKNQEKEKEYNNIINKTHLYFSFCKL